MSTSLHGGSPTYLLDDQSHHWRRHSIGLYPSLVCAKWFGRLSASSRAE